MALILDPPNTHQDRPTPKKMLAFRIIPRMIGGNAAFAIEYDTIVPLQSSGFRLVPRQINVEPHQEGCHSEPLGRLIKELMDDYWRVESERDGLLARIDQLTIDNVEQGRTIERLTNQLAEAKRSKSNGAK